MAEGVRFSDLEDSGSYIGKSFSDMLFVADLPGVDVTLKMTGRQLAEAVAREGYPGGAQINISTKEQLTASGAYFSTMIEGVSDSDLEKLADSNKYRLCLMRFRRGRLGGRSWHVSALPYFRAKRLGTTVNPQDHAIAEQYTWWPVTGKITPWLRGANIRDVLPFGVNEARYRFKNSRNIKMLDGVALFQYTGHGTEGWTRISNISYVQSYLCGRTMPARWVMFCIKE